MPKYTEKQLLKAVQYSENNPDISLPQIAALYNVNLSTLRRRKLGLTLPPSKAHREEQLFSSGEERAIVNHCITMADLNFLLRGYKQYTHIKLYKNNRYLQYLLEYVPHSSGYNN